MSLKTLNNEEYSRESAQNEILPCVLQDAVCTDGSWYLFGEPAVFDAECCEIMNLIFNGDLYPIYPIAAKAEKKSGCYIIHLD